jgi:hypothetical protein
MLDNWNLTLDGTTTAEAILAEILVLQIL